MFGIIHKEIKIGDGIVNNLKKNNKLGWTFVSKEEAEKGVIHGDYYASLLITKDFSEKVATIISDKPIKPEIQLSAFVIGVLLKKPLSRFVEQTARKAKESKIIH